MMSGLTNCIGNFYIFLIVKTFPNLVLALTLPGVYYTYAIISAAAIGFTLCFLPETKDKRLDQISRGFAEKNDETTVNSDPEVEETAII